MRPNLDILREAINRRKPVRFNYNNPKKPEASGEFRVGNPHAVYATSMGNINVDLFQTDGPIEGSSGLPSWRDYTLAYIEGLEIDEKAVPFAPCDDYKPSNQKYLRKFAKI